MTTKPSAFEELLEGIVWASCSPEAGPGSLAAARSALVSAYKELAAERDAARRTSEYWKAEHLEANKRISELEANFAQAEESRATNAALLDRALHEKEELRANALTAEEATAVLDAQFGEEPATEEDYPAYARGFAKLRSISSPQQTLTENR